MRKFTDISSSKSRNQVPRLENDSLPTLKEAEFLPGHIGEVDASIIQMQKFVARELQTTQPQQAAEPVAQPQYGQAAPTPSQLDSARNSAYQAYGDNHEAAA